MCCKDSHANISLDFTLQSKFSLLRREILQHVAIRNGEVARPLREEVTKFKLMLARVTESMGRAYLSFEHESSAVIDDDAVTLIASKASDESTDDKAPRELDMVGEECFFGCFSPRASRHRNPMYQLPLSARASMRSCM
jgi:hypothetical protein